MRLRSQTLFEALLEELRELLEPHSHCIARKGDKLKVLLVVLRRWIGRKKVQWYTFVHWLHKWRKP